MLPNDLLVIALTSNLLLLVIFLYYVFSLRIREKKIEKKEHLIDSNYHHVVDEAMSKERKILDDAIVEADQIITGAQYLTHASKVAIREAVRAVITDIQKEGSSITNTFTTGYTTSLQKITSDSTTQFQYILSQLQMDLQKQIQGVHGSMLPAIEKEVESYKQARFQEVDRIVMNIVQKASQDIFNKSLSLTDHQQLLIEALDKAKKEGVFE